MKSNHKTFKNMNQFINNQIFVKMKKSLIFTVLMALAMSGLAQQYHFAATCESGQTLYYRITDAEAHTVILTHPVSQNYIWFQGNYYGNFAQPQGEVVLPSIVNYNDVDYYVTAIDSCTFWECGITSVFIPESITSIAPRAFAYCESLETLLVDGTNPTFYSENNAIIRREDKALVVGCKTTTIPNDIKIICSQAFRGSGDSGDLVIPNSVKTIEEWAFSSSRFSGSITLSDSLETIGLYAFYLCNVSGPLVIPNSVTEIGERAFWDCHNLTSLTLPSSLSSIEKMTFDGCDFIGTLIIPNSVKQIGEFAFDGNDFSELIMGDSVVTIGFAAFVHCNDFTGSLRLPASLTEIEKWAFADTYFDEIHSPRMVPPALHPDAFQEYDTNIPIHIPFGCTEAYQNIYRDFEPDSILIYWQKLGPMWIDLDADNEFDDLLMEMHAGGYFCIPEFVTGSNIKICIAEPYSILSEVEEENWETYIGWSGLCIPCANDHYGFRIQNEDDYYYGWFETYNREIHAKNEKRVVHWGFDRTAYCTIPNYPLRWGQIYLDSIGMEGSEWYYEILDDEGNFTYQHLECTGDTVMQGKRPKIIVRSNTHYNRDTVTEVTHEYIYEENGVVYWWNKDLEEFTTLYNLTANVGDEWEIKVGTESLTMHVDAVENLEHEGRTYRMIKVSDPEDLFSGDIVCGIGHLTSFFPERLMTRGKGYRVDGMRCYWVEGELVFKYGDRNCDEVYQELHHGLDETNDNGFTVYPNPANGVLFVRLPQCDSPTTEQTEYRIINLMGQTLLQGCIDAEIQQIDISALSAGMYFFTFAGKTQKFVVK